MHDICNCKALSKNKECVWWQAGVSPLMYSDDKGDLPPREWITNEAVSQQCSPQAIPFHWCRKQGLSHSQRCTLKL